jgi:tetrapyrrole methylase family protein / MazG family protein
VAQPSLVVVGLGPAGPEHLSLEVRRILDGATRVFLRTTRHPAAAAVQGASSFDGLYESAATFDEVYGAIVEELVRAARAQPPGAPPVVYAVPGSPLVGERSVELLRAERRLEVDVVPALSFLDLAWERLGVDPLAAGVRIVDGESFVGQASGAQGPLLVAQCWSRRVLSDIKLSMDAEAEAASEAVLLFHLGLPDEALLRVPWAELDRTIEPDHLTSVWIPALSAPVAGAVAELVELMRVLRERCPWDNEQTHTSLARHLLEETYECLDAIDALGRATPAGTGVAYGHLEEELGDLLFQVVFHSCLAGEQGQFTLADVARGVHDKLVARHPHVFGDEVAGTHDELLNSWETRKAEEKGRASITDGVPLAMPSLALSSKMLSKAEAIGMAPPALGAGTDATRQLAELPRGSEEAMLAIQSILFAIVGAARVKGLDAETVCRAAALDLHEAIVRFELGGAVP